MEKVDVIISVPTIGMNFELMIPVHITVKSLLPVIVNVIQRESDMLYQPSGQELLSSISLHAMLEDNSTLAEIGIGNGEHLVLM